MIKYIVLIFLLFCLSSATVFSYDLSKLEDTFVKDGKVTAYVVVANKGSASDALAQLEIITYLGKFSDESTVGIEKLVSDIDDIYERDIISIGNPCVNNVTKDIMDYNGDCNFDEGLMQFYNKNNKNQLVIFGPSDKSTRAAVKSITNKEVEGEKKVIELTAEEKLEIKQEQEMEELRKKLEQNKQEEIQQTPELIQEPVIEEQKEQTPKIVKEEPKNEGFWNKIINFFKKLFGIK